MTPHAGETAFRVLVSIAYLLLVQRRRLLPQLVLWLFPVLVLLLIAGLVVLGLVVSTAIAGALGRLIIQWLAIPLAIAVFLAARDAWRFKPEPEEGIELTPAAHPQLWAEVNELATLAQTAPPSRIVLTPEVNAAVTEASGQRELAIGLPLIATFSRGQLRSVIAHELGHFAGGDTASAAKIMRRVAFLDLLARRASVLWRWFFRWYARLYSWAAGPASRAAELRADELSLQAAGPHTAASALRAMHTSALAWALMVENYLPLFVQSGRRASVSQALNHLIEGNREPFGEVVDDVLAAERQLAGDTHPPTRDRIARFAAASVELGSTPVDAQFAAPAVDLLGGGVHWLDQVEGEIFAQNRPLTSWDEVIGSGVEQGLNAETDRLGAFLRSNKRGDGGLRSVMGLIDDPLGPVKAITGETGPSAREAAIEALMAPVLSALINARAARVKPSWTSEAQIVAADGSELDALEKVAAAVDAGNSTQLQTWLHDLGVDIASARATASLVPQWLAAASHLTGPWKGRRDVHLWSTGLLALPEIDRATEKFDKDQGSTDHQRPRLDRASAEGLEAGRAHEGSLWWDVNQIVDGDVSTKMMVKTKMKFALVDGSELVLSSTLESEFVDSPEDFFHAMHYLTAPKDGAPD